MWDNYKFLDLPSQDLPLKHSAVGENYKVLCCDVYLEADATTVKLEVWHFRHLDGRRLMEGLIRASGLHKQSYCDVSDF